MGKGQLDVRSIGKIDAGRQTRRGVLLLVVLFAALRADAQSPCGDLDQDGDADATDALILRNELAGVAPMTAAQQLACDVIADAPPGGCSMVDVVVMTRAGLGLGPGVAPICPAASAACSSGIDEDGDGRIDYPADPGCSSPTDDDESDDCPSGPGCAQCANGLDDDGDGLVDHPLDPECSAASDPSESS